MYQIRVISKSGNTIVSDKTETLEKINFKTIDRPSYAEINRDRDSVHVCFFFSFDKEQEGDFRYEEGIEMKYGLTSGKVNLLKLNHNELNPNQIFHVTDSFKNMPVRFKTNLSTFLRIVSFILKR